MRKIAVYPGSFDPVTNGHMDIIRRASELFDELVVGVLVNHAKMPVFSLEERIYLLQKATNGIPNVTVESFEGLLVDFAARRGAGVIVRGMRAVSDFENEFSMAMANKTLSPGIETVFLFASIENMFLSSSIVKEIGGYQGDISGMVPREILEDVKIKFSGGSI
jgi:pantetheine-phosphate adenylyltransferase